MTVKEISRYRELAVRLENAKEILESLQNASQPRTAVTDGMPHGSPSKDQVGKLITAIADLTERIEFLKRELTRERRKVAAFIDRIPDERIRTAVLLKYLDGLKWDQIADAFGDKYTTEGLKYMCYRFIEGT